MFGMSSKEFWEEEPQLYWAYRFSYEKQLEFEQKKELEQMRFGCWLQGRTNEIAFAIALNNAFSKKAKDFPTYKEMFEQKEEIPYNPAREEINRLIEGITDKDVIAQIEFNYWARI